MKSHEIAALIWFGTLSVELYRWLVNFTFLWVEDQSPALRALEGLRLGRTQPLYLWSKAQFLLRPKISTDHRNLGFLFRSVQETLQHCNTLNVRQEWPKSYESKAPMKSSTLTLTPTVTSPAPSFEQSKMRKVPFKKRSPSCSFRPKLKRIEQTDLGWGWYFVKPKPMWIPRNNM